VGLPAKSGVAGGVIAVLPGQLGIGVFSPPLDARGNSVRGIAVCQELSRRFRLHQYRPGMLSTDPVRRRYGGDVARARRIRGADEVETLDREGQRIAVYELRGEILFARAERLVRAVMDDLDTVDHVILDFRRTTTLDEVSSDLIERLAVLAADRGVRLIAAHLEEGRLAVETAADTDEALQRCEEDLLDETFGPRDSLVVSLADQPLLAGLAEVEILMLERVMMPLNLALGEVLCTAGDKAEHVYFVCSGALRAELASDSGMSSRRLLTVGPGAALGEISLLDGGPRSATIVAEEPSEVRALPFDALADIGASHPGVTATLYRNLARMLASRLRRATEQVRSLEG
jgi:glutaminase